MQLTVSLTTQSGTWTCQQATTAGSRRRCPFNKGYDPSTNLLYLLLYPLFPVYLTPTCDQLLAAVLGHAMRPRL
jgi:hypothetical protein